MYVYKKKIFKVLFGFLDIIGFMVFFPVKLFRKKSFGPVHNILVIRIDHIGDVINSTVVLESLRNGFSEAKIDLMVPSWASELFECNEYIDDLILFDPPWFSREPGKMIDHLTGFVDMARKVRSGSYDIAFDLRGDIRHILAMFLGRATRRIGYGITGGGFLLTDNIDYVKERHAIDKNLALLEAVGIHSAARYLKLGFNAVSGQEAEKLLADSGLEGRFAVLHLLSGDVRKNCGRDLATELVKYISDEKKLKIVLVGGKTSSEDGVSISPFKADNLTDLSGKTTLSVLYNILKRAEIFIGVDSAPSHLAAAAGIPVIVLFSGINDPKEWAPFGDNVRVICPGENKCLEQLDFTQVSDTIDRMLNTDQR